MACNAGPGDPALWGGRVLMVQLGREVALVRAGEVLHTWSLPQLAGSVSMSGTPTLPHVYHVEPIALTTTDAKVSLRQTLLFMEVLSVAAHRRRRAWQELVAGVWRRLLPSLVLHEMLGLFFEIFVSKRADAGGDGGQHQLRGVHGAVPVARQLH